MSPDMSSAAMLRRSSGVTLLVHGVRVVAAMLMTWPLTSALQSSLLRHTYRARLGADDAALALEVGARQHWALLPWACTAVLAYAMLGPLLFMTWLHAMRSGSGDFAGALKRGLRSYLPALGLSLCTLTLFFVGLGLPALVLRVGGSLLPDAETAEDGLRVLSLGLGLLIALLLTTVHDLGCAALASDRPKPLRALRLGLRRLSMRALAYRALVSIAAAAAIAGNDALSRTASGWLGPTSLLALQQTSLLLATLLHARWLAWALCISEPQAPLERRQR